MQVDKALKDDNIPGFELSGRLKIVLRKANDFHNGNPFDFREPKVIPKNIHVIRMNRY